MERVVQMKVVLFLAMLCFAAVNRLRLLPRLLQGEDPESRQRKMEVLRKFRRNTAIEIALGLAAIYVVGVLGLTPPAGHGHGA